MIRNTVFTALLFLGFSMIAPSAKAVQVVFIIKNAGSTTGVACQTGGNILGDFSFDCTGQGTCWTPIGGGLGVVDLLVGHEGDPMPYGDNVGEYVGEL